MTKYIDDINFYLEAMELGTHWQGGRNGKVVHSDLRESNDIMGEKTKSQITMEVIRNMGESCNDWLKLTVDSKDNHKGMKVPMLDVEAWTIKDNTEVQHQFYEKEVASNRVMGAKSAISQTSKIATLSQEVIRRMQNTGRDVPEENRVIIMNNFMIKLHRSGYNEKQREEIMKAGLNGYYKKVIRENKGGTKINRESANDRARKKIMKVVKKDKWHQDKPNNTDNDITENEPKHRGNGKKIELKDGANEQKQMTESIIFIPYTPFSQLKRELQSWDNKYSVALKVPKVKFIETIGVKIRNMVCRNNPWQSRSCERAECKICNDNDTKGKGTC